MKIIVTGFEPFGGESINPSFELVKSLPGTVEGAEIVKLALPTVFGKSIETLLFAIKSENPDIILCLGQAGGRSAISIERVAINVDDARIPDTAGQQPIDSPISADGPSAYFSTLPIKNIAAAIKLQGIPAEISNSAGTYVCNHVMYGILDYIYKNNLAIKAGFIHIPYLPEQVLDKPNAPSMSLDNMIKAIETAIITMLSKEATS